MVLSCVLLHSSTFLEFSPSLFYHTNIFSLEGSTLHHESWYLLLIIALHSSRTFLLSYDLIFMHCKVSFLWFLQSFRMFQVCIAYFNRIDSESLELLQIWFSNNPYLIIDSAPSLKKMIVGAPMRKTTKLAWINIRRTPSGLQHVWFHLTSQLFRVNKVTLGQVRTIHT